MLLLMLEYVMVGSVRQVLVRPWAEAAAARALEVIPRRDLPYYPAGTEPSQDQPRRHCGGGCISYAMTWESQERFILTS